MAPVASEQLVLLEAASATGAWVAYCQVGVAQRYTAARPQVDLLIALAGAEPAPVDALVAVDGSERWLLVSQHGAPELWDTHSGARRRLGELTGERAPLGWPARARRTLAFDTSAERLFFTRGLASRGYEVLSMRLADGAVTQLFTGRGTPHGLRVGPRDRFLVVDEAGPGGSGVGMGFSFQEPKPCRGLADGIVVQPLPDAGQSRLISLVDGSSVTVEDLATPFGEGYLFRDPQGRLMQKQAGKRTTLASAECGARVIDSSPEHQLALVGCAGHRRERARKKRRHAPSAPLTRWPLRLVGPGIDRDLKLTIGPTGNDQWPELPGKSLTFVHAGAQTVLVDYERQKVVELGSGDLVVQVHERRALVLRGRTLRVLQLPDEKVLVEQSRANLAPQVLTTGPMAFVSPFVVDLTLPAVLGRVDAFALGLARDGRVLVAEGGDPEPDAWARGPLTWVKPERLATPRRP